MPAQARTQAQVYLRHPSRGRRLWLDTSPPPPPPGKAAAPGEMADALPYRVVRTKQHNLPVYLDYRHRRQRITTAIRKIEGDVMVSAAAVRECQWYRSEGVLVVWE